MNEQTDESETKHWDHIYALWIVAVVQGALIGLIFLLRLLG